MVNKGPKEQLLEWVEQSGVTPAVIARVFGVSEDIAASLWSMRGGWTLTTLVCIAEVMGYTIEMRLVPTSPELIRTLPYLPTSSEGQKHNPLYDQDAGCQCGHPYYRHFDTYDGMCPVGCKYCQCDTFKP